MLLFSHLAIYLPSIHFCVEYAILSPIEVNSYLEKMQAASVSRLRLCLHQGAIVPKSDVWAKMTNITKRVYVYRGNNLAFPLPFHYI